MQGAMAAPSVDPVTRQISGRAAPAPVPVPSGPESGQPLAAAVADLPVLDVSGRRVLFGALFRERRAVVVFVRVSAGCGTIRSRDLTRRLRRRLLPRPPLGGGYIGPLDGSRARERSPLGLALPVVIH